jgi:hypothetical protein
MYERERTERRTAGGGCAVDAVRRGYREEMRRAFVLLRVEARPSL